MKWLELFAGIGGASAALRGHGEVVRAVDQSPYAVQVYRHNFPHPVESWNIAGARAAQLEGADAWWMSPPCQPFTVRGAVRDLDDPRCRPLLRLFELLPVVRPQVLALENVAGFRTSRARLHVLKVLSDAGYHSRELELCPTSLGVPNRRRRYYLVASLQPLPEHPPLRSTDRPLAAYLDAAPDPSLYVEPALIDRYRHALPVVDAEDPDAITFCYTSAYGRSPVHSGSYVRDRVGVRRLDPSEILRLLCFPEDYRLPVDVDRARAWGLVGNSLSVAAVRHVLAPVVGLSA
ncbi:MAG: site-specific DNA-cytosine methylase [Myxococcota bacterium]|jgi:site-specific DNA-cytosine methylase